MKKIYAIQWKSRVNGRAGRGTKLFDRQEAEQLAEELNTEHPHIDHVVVQVQSEAEAAPAVPLEPALAA